MIGRSLLRDPVRLLLAAGGGLLVAGAFLDWVRGWLPYVEWFVVSGFQRAGDGILALLLGAAALVLARSERVATSRQPLLLLLPLAIGLTALAVVRIAHQDLSIYVASLTKYGGQGEFLPGFWVTAAGALATALGGAAHAWRGRDDIRRLRIRVGLGRLAAVVGGVGGTLAGLAVGVNVAHMLTTGEMAGLAASVTMLLAIAFAIAGAISGTWLGGQLGRSLAGRA